MSRLKEYKIPFTGLKEGIRRFEFQLNDEFFEEFESFDWDDGSALVILDLEKRKNMMIADFEIKSDLKLSCDRCGDPVEIHTVTKNKLVVKFGDETETEDDDILVLGPSEYELNVAPYIYEYLVLSLPSKRVHEDESDCNQEALERLNRFEDDDDKTDPRWDALKNIK